MKLKQKGVFIIQPFILIFIFIISTLVGYKIIKNVPTMLHTPLMSNMNALSGITLLGALIVTGTGLHNISKVLGFIAVLLAMLNVVGGFGVTHRMLKMFRHKEDAK